MVHGPRPAALTPSALRTAELMETRANFRKAFEESLGCECNLEYLFS